MSKDAAQSGGAELRRIQRHTFNLEDRIRLNVPSADGTRSFLVVDLNIMGARIAPVPTIDGEKAWKSLRAGTEIRDLQIAAPAGAIGHYLVARVVDLSEHLREARVLFLDRTPDTQGKRKLERLSVVEGYHPVAIARHPIVFDQKLHFQVVDLSREGLQLATSPRNGLLLVGNALDLEIALPSIGTVNARAVIRRSAMDEAKRLQLGCQFENLDMESEHRLVQFLMLFGEGATDCSIQSARSAGFKPKFLKGQMDYSLVKNIEEYQEVLSLRAVAYSRAGKISASTSPEAMADVFDLNSRIIVAKHRGRVVGSIRLTFCRQPEDKFELDASVTLPKNLDRLRTVEVSRLCVSSAFEHTDLVLGLVERATELAIKTDSKTVITSCIEEMLPYYRKLAFYPTGLEFKLATLNSIPHYLLMHDCMSHRRGLNIHPLAWHLAYRNVVEHSRKIGYLNEGLSTYRKIWVGLWAWFFGFMKRFRSRQRVTNGKPMATAAHPMKVEGEQAPATRATEQ